MWTTIISLVGGAMSIFRGSTSIFDAVAHTTRHIAKMQELANNAENEREKNFYQAKVDAGNIRLQGLMSGEKFKFVAILNALVRLAFALPFIIYIWQVVAIDKVLMVGGKTDDLSIELWQAFFAILAFYFASVLLDKIIR